MTRQTPALRTDLYQLTMAQGYFHSGMDRSMACFDYFFREPPFGGGFAIFAGLSEILDYLVNFSFDDGEIDYLRSLNLFSDDYLDHLRSFRFTGDVLAMPEGSVVFPREPIVRVTAPIDQAQIIETVLLNRLNFMTLIATKAARVCHAAGPGEVMEFGLRRAQGPDGALSASRAAYIGGCSSTSNVEAGQKFGIPVKGTHAHSWVTAFPDELTAFRTYARLYPAATILLVDTYDTLASGVPNAITVGKELEAEGERLVGIRLDSGDLGYLSQEARKMLDDAGLDYVKIVASNDLDEHIIHDLTSQGARIDIYGVGTRLVTAKDDPALGGVYKLAAIKNDDQSSWVDKMKLAEGLSKATLPGFKQVWRLFDAAGEMMADIIEEEGVEHDYQGDLVTGYHPVTLIDKKRFDGVAMAEPMLRPVMLKGELIAPSPPLEEIRDEAAQSLTRLHPTSKRILNPHIYKVSLGPSLAAKTKRMREGGVDS